MANFRMNLAPPPVMVVPAMGRAIPDFVPGINPKPPCTCAGRRGWIPLAGSLTSATLYLIFFRDVLKRKETE